MKLFSKKRKGFTIVELVIVVAVIAVLAAILIPTFVGLVNKAHIAADDSLVRDLNNVLAIDREVNGEHQTMHDALKVTDEYGFNVQRINAKANKSEILWDSENDVFCYFDGQTEQITYIPEVKLKTPKDEVKPWQYFVIKKGVASSADLSNKYSTYLYQSTATSLTTTFGLDVGDETKVTSITYERSAGTGTQEVVIRTNSFGTTLKINAEKDTVKHYGNAAVVDVEAIAPESYHESGVVGRLSVASGHAVAEAEAVIFCFNNNGAAEATPSTVEVKSGATVYNNNGEAAGLEAVNTTVATFKDDCGAGHHDFGSQLVIDSHVYEVCKSCGYTLITVQDNSGNEVKQTKNVLDENGDVVSQVITPIETYLVSEPVNTNPSVETVKNYEVTGDPIVETPKVEHGLDQSACDHEFNEGVITTAPTCTSTGVKTYTCSKCGETYTITVAKAAHSYYDNIGNVHTPDEECIVCHQKRNATAVAKIGNTEYASLKEALNAVYASSDTSATIVMLQDDAAYLTKGEGDIRYAAWHIKNNKNITIDLAGYTLKDLIYFEGVANPSTDYNNGVFVVSPGASLTIKDSSCSYGSTTDGTGKVYNELDSRVMGTYWPTVNRSDDVILNLGTFTLQSGTLESKAGGYISFVVDNVLPTAADVTMNISGGKLINNIGEADLVRLWTYSDGKKVTATITGGYFEVLGDGCAALWMHGGNTASNIIKVSGGTFNTKTKAINPNPGQAYIEVTGGTFYQDGTDVSASVKSQYPAN